MTLELSHSGFFLGSVSQLSQQKTMGLFTPLFPYFTKEIRLFSLLLKSIKKICVRSISAVCKHKAPLLMNEMR